PITDCFQRRELRQLTPDLRGEDLIDNHNADNEGDHQSRTKKHPDRGSRGPIPSLVSFELGTSKNLNPGAEELAQRSRAILGIDSRFQLDQPQIDLAQLAIGEETHKILTADKDHTKAHKARSENVVPSYLHLIAVDFDHSAGRQWAEHRSRHAIHQNGV